MPFVATTHPARFLLDFSRVPASADSAPPNSVVDSPDVTYAYDMERQPSDCIGLNPLPGCGKAPTQAGDRGGALQGATFGVIIVGLAIIFTVIFRSVIRSDRRKAAEVADPNQKWSPRS